MATPQKHEDMLKRLQALEDRVARLEGSADTSGASDVVAAERDASPPEPTASPEQPSAPSPSSSSPAEPSAALSRGKSIEEPLARPKQGHARPEADLEAFFGVKVIGRIGVAAVVLAACYFGQIGWGLLGPGARAALVYLIGGAMIYAGFVLRERADKTYVALMWGGGVAILYVAGALAHLRYDVTGEWFALASLLMTAGVAQWLARMLQLETLATVALGGAYAAPVLVGSPSPTPTGFFILLLSLHSWAAWTEHRFQWRSARLLAVVATIGFVLAWYGRNGCEDAWSLFWHLEAVWLVVTLPELLSGAARRTVSDPRVVAVAALGLAANAAIVLFPGTCSWSGLALGGALLLVGVYYAPLCPPLGMWIARIPAVLMPLGVIFCLGDVRTEHITPAWQFVIAAYGVAALLLCSRRLVRVGELGACIATATVLVHVSIFVSPDTGLSLSQAPLLLFAPVALMTTGRGNPPVIFGFLAAAACCCIGVHQPTDAGIWGFVMSDEARLLTTLISLSVLASFATVVSGVRAIKPLGDVAIAFHVLTLLVWILECSHDAQGASVPLTPVINTRMLGMTVLVASVLFARARLSSQEDARRILGCTALIGGYIAGVLEVYGVAHGWSFGLRAAAVSTYSLAFAAALLIAGFRYEVLALRGVALVGFVLIAGKVVLYDLHRAETSMRVLVSAVLGVVLLLVAWRYARRRSS